MPAFKVFQIDGEKYPQEAADAFMFPTKVYSRARAQANLDHGFYKHVATVAAGDIEDVFVIMNRWTPEDEALVKRLAPLHSLSIGDVVEEPDGSKHVVASFGFVGVSK